MQELQIALEVLRKENARLAKIESAHRAELTLATNRLAQLERRLASQREGLMADDEEARSAEEWRSFLLQALKTLGNTDRELAQFEERLRLLHTTSQEALKSAEKVNPRKRSLLEAELRQSEKLLAEQTVPETPINIIPASKPIPKEGKVIAVNLDLGVVALAIGHKQGARVGMPFFVMRKKEVLAVLMLVEVREDKSLALIEQMDCNQPVAKGDTAVLRKL